MPQTQFFFVRDGIHSVADYNSTLIGVVVVVVVVVRFLSLADFPPGTMGWRLSVVCLSVVCVCVCLSPP